MSLELENNELMERLIHIMNFIDDNPENRPFTTEIVKILMNILSTNNFSFNLLKTKLIYKQILIGKRDGELSFNKGEMLEMLGSVIALDLDKSKENISS